MLSYVQARTPRGEKCFRHGSARTHGRDDSSAACASSVAASTEWAVCRRCCRRGRAALRFGASEKEHRQESQHGPPGKKRREANIAADLSPCFANFPCCRRRVSPCSLYGRLRSLECAARCALCRRKLCGRGDIQTTLEYYGFSTSLYQFRLNVRYTTGRSASLLLAPVWSEEARGHVRHGPATGALPPVPSVGSAEAGRGGRGAGCGVLRR